jgi:hypothetical protein
MALGSLLDRSAAVFGRAGMAVVLGTGLCALSAGAGEVAITQEGGKLRIEINGEFFADYHYKDVSRPFLYPIMGPGHRPMTRDWPMKETPGEERDHRHHRSLWWAHGDINGVDFWSESPKAGKTVHERFIVLKNGPEAGVIRARNQLVAADGTGVATEEQEVRILNRKEDRMIDLEVTVHADQGELTFGDTKEGSMAIRLAESMRLVREKKPGLGHIVNSEGVRDGQTWGKRAKWCDYYGPVNGEVVGVAIFDHPSNPRHPTWWHVRDYGLFAANPFGVHDFEKQPPGTGKLVVPKGQSVTFRYRFYFHRGDEKEGRVAEHYEAYADSRGGPAKP